MIGKKNSSNSLFSCLLRVQKTSSSFMLLKQRMQKLIFLAKRSDFIWGLKASFSEALRGILQSRSFTKRQTRCYEQSLNNLCSPTQTGMLTRNMESCQITILSNSISEKLYNLRPQFGSQVVEKKRCVLQMTSKTTICFRT